MSDTTRKTGRGRPKTLRKADVADVAMQAYWKHGPSEVSLNAICQQAKVSKPSVYREFGNEDGLTHAALSTYAEKVLSKFMEIVQSEDSFARKINKLVHLSAEDSLHADGCLFIKMRASKAELGPTTQQLIGSIDRMTLEAFSTVLAEALASGEWSGDIPVALGARYLQAQIGLALDQRARGEDPGETLALALSVFRFSDH